MLRRWWETGQKPAGLRFGRDPECGVIRRKSFSDAAHRWVFFVWKSCSSELGNFSKTKNPSALHAEGFP